MPPKNVFVLETEESPWRVLLEEFFEDTLSKPTFFSDSGSSSQGLGRMVPDIAFINERLLSLALTQKIKVIRASSPDFRLFRLGPFSEKASSFSFDPIFPEVPSMSAFQKQLVEYLPLPEKIQVLVVDDEPEIGTMFRDFLHGRIHPAFEVTCAKDGAEGLEVIRQKAPNVLVLDIKMPGKDGREVYRKLKKQGSSIPVIIFFDAILGCEIKDIHQIGKPAIVEKGSRQSSMPELMSLIKKMAYFG